MSVYLASLSSRSISVFVLRLVGLVSLGNEELLLVHFEGHGLYRVERLLLGPNDLTLHRLGVLQADLNSVCALFAEHLSAHLLNIQVVN